VNLMSRSCAQWRGEIGAYIVGALDSAGRDQVTRHLAACPGCRADYDDITPVRKSLGLLALAAGEPGVRRQPLGPLPDPPTDARLLQTRRTPAGRPAARRWLTAAGTALAAAVAAIALLISSGAPARTFRAVDTATGVSGRAQLHDTPAGTQINLTATGLPANERCKLVAVTRHGTDIAGTWTATYHGSAQIAGTTAFRPGQLTALRIESDTGSLLLTIRL
jgi:Putative zinc-finger